MKKWIFRGVIAVLALVLIAVAAGYAWLRHSRPVNEGTLSLAGLRNPVEVVFDEAGIPHIYASNETDLYMAFGYIHAQDRLFQMEMMRRAGSGRLSEVIGESLLPVDRLFRALGLTEYAERSAAALLSNTDTRILRCTEAYLAGVNTFIANGPTPPEFSIIGIPKEPFTVRDMFAITGAMSFSFSQAHKTDPVVDHIARSLGGEYLESIALWHDSLESFNPSYRGPAFTSEQERAVLRNFAVAVDGVGQLLPIAPLEGSNSWVVSGQRTRNGEVIFCNDTHIGYAIPQTWYEAHLHCPEHEIYGHFLAGVPFALVGRTRSHSWGLTMLLNDDMDFYREHLSAQDSTQVMYRDAFIPVEYRSYSIPVKDKDPVAFTVRATPHGPVINDVFEGFDPTHPVSVCWTYTQLPNRTVEAFFGMNTARSLEEFNSFLPLIHAPGLNVNYGDTAGNIAWWACASLVRRPEQVNSWTVLDGAHGTDDPLGYYDFAENPSSINPPVGFVYSANDWPGQVDGMWYPGYYKPQYRADRIRSLLSESRDWTAEEMKSVMNDATNVADARTMALLRDILYDHTDFARSREAQLYAPSFDWDGTYEPEEFAPTLFSTMVYFYMHHACADEMGEDLFRLFLSTHQFQRAQTVLLESADAPWWDNIHTEERETRSQIVHAAFQDAVRVLRAAYGDNPKLWSWKKACTLELRHPLGEVALFRPLFNIGPAPVYGGNETILQSGFQLDSTGHFKVFFGSQMRIITELSGGGEAWNITPGGQSGHVMSPYYGDQFERYIHREFRRQYFTDLRGSGAALRLVP